VAEPFLFNLCKIQLTPQAKYLTGQPSNIIRVTIRHGCGKKTGVAHRGLQVEWRWIEDGLFENAVELSDNTLGTIHGWTWWEYINEHEKGMYYSSLIAMVNRIMMIKSIYVHSATR
jgi:hypothetical protein